MAVGAHLKWNDRGLFGSTIPSFFECEENHETSEVG
jgi:hypothetical protein